MRYRRREVGLTAGNGVFLIWRLIYGVLSATVTVWCTVTAVRIVRAIKGGAFADRLLAAIETKLVYSGWPIHPRGWTNLHASRSFTRVRRRLKSAVVVPRALAQPRRGECLRIGIVGKFRGILSFSKELIEACPQQLDLIVDLAYEGQTAEYLRSSATAYLPVHLDSAASYDSTIRHTADAINATHLDVLLNVNMKAESHDLLDRVQTPFIVNFCAGSDLLHHPKVDVQLFGQPQADYFMKDGRMFCGTTRTWFGDDVVLPIPGIYDRRGLCDTPLGWAAREPLLVFHGSLYKLASPPALTCIFSLLADDPALEFVFMGKGSADALATIQGEARRLDVAARVHYEGVFSSTRNREGAVDDPGWARMVGCLRRARLAPDPWPIPGASSRFESYILGVPVAHMGVRFDRASWGRSQPAVIEMLPLLVRGGTAFSVGEYRALCLKCLYDEGFADALAADQLAVAQRACDPHAWWAHVLTTCETWRGRTTGR